MIITAVVGLITLMITMFIGVRWFLDKGPSPLPPSENITTEVEKTDKVDDVAFSSIIRATVKEIGDDSIKVFDLEKQQIVTATIQPSTKIKDAYDKAMPLSMIQAGDLVELVYEPHKDNLIQINYTIDSWKKSDMKGIVIDRSNRVMPIGSKNYKYNEHVLVLDPKGNVITMDEVGDYDILELCGIGEHVYTVRVLGKQGYIALEGLPSYQGLVEIDINRQIPLAEGIEKIAVAEGKHKITLKMEGYSPVIQEVDVKSGEVLVFNASGASKKETALQIEVMNTNVDYKVQVGDALYKKGDKIVVNSGMHYVAVHAAGYQSWSGNMMLEEPVVKLQVTLQAKEVQPTPEEPSKEPTAEPGTDKPAVDYSINISTEPGDAKVYINGEYKGQTPYKVTLEVGEYSVMLQKEGYKTYETNLLIDNSDNQNSYLYMLIPE